MSAMSQQSPTHELYHKATLAFASAIASATAYPIPSAAPVTTTTLPLRRNCSRTFEGVSGNGRGNPSRLGALSLIDMDMFMGIGGCYLQRTNSAAQDLMKRDLLRKMFAGLLQCLLHRERKLCNSQYVDTWGMKLGGDSSPVKVLFPLLNRVFL